MLLTANLNDLKNLQWVKLFIGLLNALSSIIPQICLLLLTFSLEDYWSGSLYDILQLGFV